MAAQDLTINDTIEHFDGNRYSEIQKIKSNALIKSYGDLQIYNNIEYKDFPLNLFKSNESKENFLSSLKFNEKGLTSYNYSSLKELKSADVYKILSLFGHQHNITLINNNTTKGLGDDSSGAPGDHKDYKCYSRASCKKAMQYICTSNC